MAGEASEQGLAELIDRASPQSAIHRILLMYSLLPSSRLKVNTAGE